MNRSKRSATQKKISYTQNVGSDEEEANVERSDSEHLDDASDSEGGMVDPGDFDQEEEDATAEVVPKRKARVPSSKVKGKGKAKGQAGKLQSMVNLPIDVWFMIGEELDPPSLLNMGRANKMMRSLFASKENSQALWNVVKRSVHLPELDATDFNDLALTSLIYERNCHVCGKGRAILVDYALRKRWCKMCRSSNLVLENRLRSQVQHLTEYTVACSLFTNQGNTNYNWNAKRYHFRPETIAINNKILNYKQEIEDASGKKAKKEAKRELLEYIKQRKALVKSAFEDGNKLAQWERSSAADRRAVDTAARQARQDAIRAKLLDMGYQEQDLNGLWKVNSLMDQPTALTDTIWRKISPKIVAEAEVTRNSRLITEAQNRAEARRQKIEPFYQALREGSDSKKFFPSFSLFTSMPVIKVFWKEEDSSIDEDAWHNALGEIQVELSKVARWIKLEFARALVRAHENVNNPLPIELSSSIHPRNPAAPSHSYGIGSRYDHDSALDIDDTSTITSQELDALLGRLTATFSTFALKEPVRWEKYYELFPDVVVRGIGDIILKHWLRTQIDVLKQMGLEDDSGSLLKLQAAGPKFTCDCCLDNLPYRSPLYWAQHEPEKSTGLTWDEMVAHAFEWHSSPYHSSGSSSVRILYDDRSSVIMDERGPTPAPTDEQRIKVEGAGEGGDSAVGDVQGDDSVKEEENADVSSNNELEIDNEV